MSDWLATMDYLAFRLLDNGVGQSRWYRSIHLVAWVSLALLTAISMRDLLVWMSRPEGNDLSAYLAAARALIAGGDPYAVPLPQGFNKYPLTIATLLVPLTWLPVAVAQFGWFALNVAPSLGRSARWTVCGYLRSAPGMCAVTSPSSFAWPLWPGRSSIHSIAISSSARST